MNIKQAKQEIKNTIEAYLYRDAYGSYMIPPIRQRPVLLIGPPGIGKTQIMEQISIECGIGLVSYTITHHTRQSAVGLPFISKKEYDGQLYSVTEYTMSEIVAAIYDKIEASGLQEGMLFIDEINCVSETLAPTMLQFLQCKTFGNHQIPKGWIIVAAGNPPEFNKSVREFDVVTLDRIKMIHVEADYEVWKEYAYQQSVHPAILSYLDIKRQNFCQIETTVEGKRFATPRGWEDLSRLIEVYERLKKTADRDVIFQYIQFPKISKDFANFLELHYKYQSDYQVEEILNGVIREDLCDRIHRAPFDEKLSVTGLLLSGLRTQFQAVGTQEELASIIMEWLKKFQENTGNKEECSAFDRMDDLVNSFLHEWEHKKEAKLLTRKVNYLYQDVAQKLENYSKTLRTELLSDPDEAWLCLKKLFKEEQDKYLFLVEKGGSMLEYAFDFMEAAFGSGQELVIFVTELNSGYDSVSFLKAYDCERYYQYNKALLFEDLEKKLKIKTDQFCIERQPSGDTSS